MLCQLNGLELVCFFFTILGVADICCLDSSVSSRPVPLSSETASIVQVQPANDPGLLLESLSSGTTDLSSSEALECALQYVEDRVTRQRVLVATEQAVLAALEQEVHQVRKRISLSRARERLQNRNRG